MNTANQPSTKHYALIGMPLEHSLSKLCFDLQQFDNADYRLEPMSTLEGLREWVTRESIAGFNVTSPHKEAVMEYLDWLSPVALRIGAVNCVVVREGRLEGHNTDSLAFLTTMPGDGPWDAVAVLGSGGAAKAVAYALRGHYAGCLLASRNPERHPGTVSYEEVRKRLECAGRCLLVNATPVGTWPHTQESPWPWPEMIHEGFTVVDLVYNPIQSLLLQQAEAAGARVQNGLEMLNRQAELSWDLWGLRHLDLMKEIMPPEDETWPPQQV